MDLTLIISFGVLLGCLIALSWFAGSDAPFVATIVDTKKILKLAGVKKGKKFYELGSGDGRVVIEAAKLGANGVGIEQSLLRVLYSRFRARKLASHLRSRNVEFHHQNIFSRNYADADFIYLFLLPKGILKLEGKLKKELKKGAVVITQTFHFKNWRPFKKIFVGEKTDKYKLGPEKYAGDFYIYKR